MHACIIIVAAIRLPYHLPIKWKNIISVATYIISILYLPTVILWYKVSIKFLVGT